MDLIHFFPHKSVIFFGDFGNDLCLYSRFWFFMKFLIIFDFVWNVGILTAKMVFISSFWFSSFYLHYSFTSLFSLCTWFIEYKLKFIVDQFLQIKTYPRNIENSLRRKDEKRKRKREEKKKRREEQLLQKQREVKQLKKQKKAEMLERIKKLKEITGNPQVGFDVSL